MRKDEILALINLAIAGQGNQIDASGKLAVILKGILDIASSACQRVELIYDYRNNSITKRGESEHLNYEQIAELVNDKGKFVTLFTIEGEFLLPQLNDGGAMIFTGLNVLSTGSYAHRVAINVDNEIKQDYYELQRVNE